MRVISSLWVAAYLRRCAVANAFGAVVHRGAADAGAIVIKVNRLDGTALIYTPAPQSLLQDAGSGAGRLWHAYRDGEALEEAEADRYLRSELKFDPDLWIVEIEDRTGRHFLLPEEIAVPADEVRR